MGRWEPNASERLQQAGMALFQERGYAPVTVAEIAERAGLTKRSFFNHFPDKREVPFAGSAALQADVLHALRDADPDLDPLNAAVQALTRGGLALAEHITFAAVRRELIASSAELRERNLVKLTELTDAVSLALTSRHVPERIAHLQAHAAVSVFATAYDDWASDPDADFANLMLQGLADLRHALCKDSSSRGAGKSTEVKRPAAL